MILSYKLDENTIQKDLEIVDENDQIINNTSYLSTSHGKKNYFRSANCLITKNSKILTPTRSKSHRFLPSALDFSYSSLIYSGENPTTNVIKGLKKELDISALESDLNFLGKLSPLIDQVKTFVYVFKIKIDSDVVYKGTDFQSWELLNPRDLIERLKTNSFANPDLLAVLLKFQEAL